MKKLFLLIIILMATSSYALAEEGDADWWPDWWNGSYLTQPVKTPQNDTYGFDTYGPGSACCPECGPYHYCGFYI